MKATAADRAPHAEGMYGKELPIVGGLGIGRTMAARVVGKTLYTIGAGKLHVADISNPAKPKVLGMIDSLGKTRQIAVKDDVAYITSREDGVFIVDVSKPRRPELLCHYDAIEVATGIDVSGDIMFVACRSHGVELVDVSNPKKPIHLSTARTGEAQSVEVRTGYAYVGVWGSSELVVADVRNPREPKITARCPLDGYGDGVAVRGKYVYIATGHHSKERPRAREGDPGYARGHGLEIFKITNPARPTFVSRIKCPRFYRIGMDMWSVKIGGDYAFVADTYNGIFVVDIKNPRKPTFAAHRRLPSVGRTKLPGVVGGLAFAKDYIYVAGASTDLHVVEAKGLTQPTEKESDEAPKIPKFKQRKDKRFRIYRADGQVRGVDFMGNTAVLACGSDGIHVLQVWPKFKRLNRYETQGFAMAVAVCGKHVYVAEERGGLSIWRRSAKGALEFHSRYKPRNRIVRDVIVPPPGKYAVLQIDLAILDILDVSNPTRPKRVFRDKGHGFVYHIGERLLDGKVLCVLWQLGGLRWYDLYGGDEPGFTGDRYAHRVGGDGTVLVGDQWLLVYRGGLVTIGPDEDRAPTELKVRKLGGHRLKGKPRFFDGKLYLSQRTSGDIKIVDVSDIEKAKLVEQFNVPGNPGKLVAHNGALVIPNGYEGLWVEK